MRFIVSVILLASFTVIGGCTLHQVKGEIGGVKVEAKTKEGNGDFCPPGQAKKGNC